MTATFVDEFIKAMHPSKRKIVSYHSPPGPVLMIHKAKRATERNTSNNRKFIEQYPALLVTPIKSKPKNNTVALQIAFKEMFVTSALVSTQAPGLVQISAHRNVAKSHA